MNERERTELSGTTRRMRRHIIRMIGRSGKPDDLYAHFQLTTADSAAAGVRLLSRP